MVYHTLQDGQRESGRLSATGLGEANQVSALQRGWNSFRLNWSRSLVAKAGTCITQGIDNALKVDWSITNVSSKTPNITYQLLEA